MCACTPRQGVYTYLACSTAQAIVWVQGLHSRCPACPELLLLRLTQLLHSAASYARCTEQWHHRFIQSLHAPPDGFNPVVASTQATIVCTTFKPQAVCSPCALCLSVMPLRRNTQCRNCRTSVAHALVACCCLLACGSCVAPSARACTPETPSCTPACVRCCTLLVLKSCS